MKSLIIVAFLASFLAQESSLAESNTNKSDGELKELIVGKWAMKFGSLSGISDYHSDGILKQNIVLSLEKETKKSKFEYSWDIQHGKLIRVVSQSEWQTLIPSGKITYDTIVELNSERLVLVHEDGEETIQVRIK